MKKKDKPYKYLKFYRRGIKENSEPESHIFLCMWFEFDRLFKLFKPTPEELEIHYSQGYARHSWGESTKTAYSERNSGRFTDFRQNIILFMAAINGEL